MSNCPYSSFSASTGLTFDTKMIYSGYKEIAEALVIDVSFAHLYHSKVLTIKTFH